MKIWKYGLCLVLISTWAFGQTPIISSFNRDGHLVCAGLRPGTVAYLSWAPSALGPWTVLDETTATVDPSGSVTLKAPSAGAATQFYRVLGMGMPVGMSFIPDGSFSMGDSMDSNSGERPVHTVTVSAFYMDRTEVTKKLWDEVCHWATNRPSELRYSFDYKLLVQGTNYPVHAMSWCDAVKWCNARSERVGLVPAYYTSAAQTTVYRVGQLVLRDDWVKWNAGYRLPTEAEWEKAARGGASGHRFPWSETDTITHNQANYNSTNLFAYDISLTRGFHPTFGKNTSPVGSFAPNGYGLYDMAGNVSEWCWDWNGSYSSGSQTDPLGPYSGLGRTIRGGYWYWDASNCRVAKRMFNMNPSSGVSGTGFRSVLPSEQP